MLNLLKSATGKTVNRFLDFKNVYYQLPADKLVEQSLRRGEGILNDTGVLCINTGEFTGRSPQDKFIVKDEITEKTVDWNHFNLPVEEHYFLRLRDKMQDYMAAKDNLWIRDAYACASPAYRLSLRVINENPWSNLFACNMFLRPTETDLEYFTPQWHIIHLPGFRADPAADGTRSPHFAMISFKYQTILIGGTGYTGEMKKGIFTVLNYVLPYDKKILSMHCSANKGQGGDVAIFFGLSGTGKTTLSADPARRLIGDDEHGWSDTDVFNFEGGCYAKLIDLSREKEPEIYNAIRPGALVENVTFLENGRQIDFASKKITENTRVSYPLDFMRNTLHPSIGNTPENIFFLTCDARGVLPPISKLSTEQAMYQFISGYTAKVAGTEAGITEPKATFSACFSAPFLPLHPGFYAKMLGDKIKKQHVNVWLVNTGWSGGGYGTGRRIELKYTRAMIAAALNGQLNQASYEADPIFGMMVPASCPAVPENILNPRNAWVDKDAYDAAARNLAYLFVKNFEQYAAGVDSGILAAAPRVDVASV
ncbi:MAG TPA: phosphoenolpyruvate carboxykinase (ATP) [Chitinophagaceae bacterium]|jgi:phosphoenolpyruvate carboxykinase (ATP)